MTITEYLNAVKERLTTDPVVAGFSVVRERVTLIDGHLRARLALFDGSVLEFSEYVQRSSDDQIDVVTYSYHWTDADGNLIRRWDNTPHFPDLPGFPHHVHDGRAGSVVPGQPANIFLILDEIARILA
jgi:hypothetical protein